MSIHKRTTKSGQTRYDVRLRKPDGTPYSTTFRTKREAERFESKQLSERDQGTWIDPHAGKVTFQEWANEWHATMVHSWRPSTAARHRSALDEHWIPMFGSIRLNSISPRSVQQCVNTLTGQLQPSTVRSYYGTLRNCLGDAADKDIISRSPCRGIKMPASTHLERKIITPSDLHRLADAVGPRWRCMIYLGGVLGLRFGEIAGLRIDDINLDARTVAIVRTVSEIRGELTLGPPKTSSGARVLPLPEPLVNELRLHISTLNTQHTDATVFQDNYGNHVRRSNFRTRVWTPAVAKTGLLGLTFHGLRHSAATNWIAEGIDARTVQYLLGHSDPRLVLRLYAHTEDRAVRTAMGKLSRVFWA